MYCLLCEQVIGTESSAGYCRMELRSGDGWTSWVIYFHKNCFRKANIFKAESRPYTGCPICKKSPTNVYLYISSFISNTHISCFKKFIIDKRLEEIVNLLTSGLK